MKAVAKALAEGRIGQLRHIHGHGKTYYGGYNLMNIGTHMINNMPQGRRPVRQRRSHRHHRRPRHHPDGCGAFSAGHGHHRWRTHHGDAQLCRWRHRNPPATPLSHSSQSGDRILRQRRPLSALAARVGKGTSARSCCRSPTTPSTTKENLGKCFRPSTARATIRRVRPTQTTTPM